MYTNTYLPVVSLSKAPVKTSGVCSVKYFRIEDVLTWPAISPLTGILETSITLKPGTFIYYADTIDQTRAFQEEQKESNAGTFFDVAVKAALRGSNAANILTLQKLTAHQFGVIVEDRNGVTRLIGNQDSGAKLSHRYNSGTLNSSRKTEIEFTWQHPLTCPVYTAEAFDIIIGGLPITTGCIQFIKSFKVGAAGAPMNEGDTLYINALLINKRVLVMADGINLPVDDFSGDVDWTGSIQRHIEKATASNTINFVGSVINEEIIDIYGFT